MHRRGFSPFVNNNHRNCSKYIPQVALPIYSNQVFWNDHLMCIANIIGMKKDGPTKNSKKNSMKNATTIRNATSTSNFRIEEPTHEEIFKKLKLDLEEKKLAETILSEILKKETNVKWDDIAGLTEVKELLFESLVLPVAIPEYFDKLRKPWKGVLLVGPPGTGKTMLAKAAATETKSKFFNITSSTLTSKYFGDSEKLVRLLFLLAKEMAPSIVFFDEIDSFCSHRSQSSDLGKKIKSQLLCQMDGLSSLSHEDPTRSVIILSATNFPWDLDEAFRRRLEKRIYIPLPDHSTRLSLLKLLLHNVIVDKDVDFNLLATQLEGYSSADILVMTRDAAFMTMRRFLRKSRNVAMKDIPDTELVKPITKADFDEAILNCPKTLQLENAKKYTDWILEYGSR